MKRVFSFAIVFILIFSSISVMAFAETESNTKEICIYNSKGEKIIPLMDKKGYNYDPDGTPTPIVFNDNELDLTTLGSFDHFVRVATNYIRDLKPDEIYTIKIPKGSYQVATTINVYSNTNIDFGGSTLYRTSNKVLLKLGVVSKTNSYNEYNCVQNITASNAVLDGQNKKFATDGDDATIIKFSHSKNITVTNISIQNTKNVHHQLAFAACKNVKITNCSFSNMDVNGSKNNCEAIQIDVLDDYYFESAYYYDGTTTKDVIIENCKFNNVNRGVGTHTGIAGYYFDNIKIRNNIFQNVEGYAIRVTNYRNSEITNNTITNCGSGIMIANMANRDFSQFLAPIDQKYTIIPQCNITVSGNKMTIVDSDYPTTAFGIDVLGVNVTSNRTDKNGKSYKGDFRVSDVDIKNNTITSSVAKKRFMGMRIDGVFGSENSKNSNFAITGNTIEITNTYKSTNTIYGICIEDGEYLCCYNNTISDKNAYNISLKNAFYGINSGSFFISENKVLNVLNSGMKFESCINTSVYKNSISNTSSNGIYFSQSSRNAFVNLNTISSVKDKAVSFNNSTANSINNNTISSAYNAGIAASGNSYINTVQNNSISATSNNAMYFTDNSSITSISKNKINTAGKTGITFTQKASVKNVNNNNILTTGSHAITLNTSAKATNINSNTINKAKGNSIYLTNSASASNIKSNTITNSKGFSIHLSKKSKAALIYKNKICKSQNIAVYLNSKASATSIGKNIIDLTKSKVDAIYIYGSASAKKINSNIINYKKNKNSKNLKVKCSNGIAINSKASKTAQIYSNKIKSCNNGIAVYAVKTKAKIKSNTVNTCKYGIQYIKGAVSKNKISKASIAKTEIIEVDKTAKQ